MISPIEAEDFKAISKMTRNLSLKWHFAKIKVTACYKFALTDNFNELNLLLSRTC